MAPKRSGLAPVFGNGTKGKISSDIKPPLREKKIWFPLSRLACSEHFMLIIWLMLLKKNCIKDFLKFVHLIKIVIGAEKNINSIV